MHPQDFQWKMASEIKRILEDLRSHVTNSDYVDPYRVDMAAAQLREIARQVRSTEKTGKVT